jgi:uncharacterized protein (TIGR03118 family)
VDVFDTNFAAHSFGTNAFVDATIPVGFAPFNVATINGNIVVTYAKQNSQKHDDIAGPGNGYVRIFDSSGNLMLRLPHVNLLNSPWGIVMAPATGFGQASGKLLIGNFGSGAIVAFDIVHQQAINSPLLDSSGLPLRINGLWGLGFGNGASSGPTTTLYFAAGYFEEAHGLFGTIALPTTSASQPKAAQ